jgi:hypothetical protein
VEEQKEPETIEPVEEEPLEPVEEEPVMQSRTVDNPLLKAFFMSDD